MSRPLPLRPLGLLSPPYLQPPPRGRGWPSSSSRGAPRAARLCGRWGAASTQQDAGVVRGRPGGLPLLVVLPPAGVPLARHGPSSASWRRSAPRASSPTTRRPPQRTWPACSAAPGGPRVRGDRLPTVARDRARPGDLGQLVAASSGCRPSCDPFRGWREPCTSPGGRLDGASWPRAAGPSHWLHFARLLRVTIRLQNSQDSVLSVGYELGYPDGFSLSNQMARLTGYRPTEARMYLGWEWLLEAWLRQEAETGGLSPDTVGAFIDKAPPAPRPIGTSATPGPHARNPSRTDHRRIGG